MRYTVGSCPSTPDKKISPLISSTPDLTLLLSSPKFSVRKVFKTPHLARLIVTQNPQIFSYFKSHISDLLKIALNVEDQFSKNAFDLLEGGQKDITDELCAGDYIQIISQSILVNTQLNPISLFRICQLTYQIILFYPISFPTNCEFIMKLLSFIEHQTVLSFFENIFTDDSRLNAAQNFLIRQGIVNILTEPLSKWPVDHTAHYGDKEFEKLHNSLQLFRVASTVPRLSAEFIKPFIIQIFQFRVSILPSIVEAQRWKVLDALYSMKSAYLFRGLFLNALEIISEPYDTVQEIHVCALNLISKMIQYDHVLIQFIRDSQIWQVLTRLLIQFPLHTFIARSIYNFFNQAFQIKDLHQKCGDILLTLFLDNKNETGILRFAIGKCAIDYAKQDKEFDVMIKEIPGYDSWKEEQDKRERCNGYGGKTPHHSTISEEII